MRLCLPRELHIPDKVKLARYSQAPGLGPKVLFFSGGSALRSLSQGLINYTHNSVHVITPFDSGGSSAVLRQAFAMPAVGDIRNRLMALADQSIQGNPEIYALFAHRLPKQGPQSELLATLQSLARGEHALIQAVPEPLQSIIRRHLLVFSQYIDQDFDLRGASIGNLILAAGYLENERDLDPVIYIYSKLAEVRGTVRPVAKGHYHVGALLADGSRLIGQHVLTGKEGLPLDCSIARLFLTPAANPDQACTVPAEPEVLDYIQKADLICYPMGSFFTSLVANLLPQGVGASIGGAGCPKVFIPNSYPDPECPDMSLMDQVRTLLQYVHLPSGKVTDSLNVVLLDTKLDRYPGEVDIQALEAMGMQVVVTDLVSAASEPAIDPDRLLPVLLSLA